MSSTCRSSTSCSSSFSCTLPLPCTWDMCRSWTSSPWWESACIRGPQRGCRAGDPVRPALHPVSTPTRLPRWGPRFWLRCSSLKYSRYSRSSRLAIRAHRRPRCSGGLPPRTADVGVRASAAWRTISVRALIVASIVISVATAARAGQLGKLLSPGPLAKAHGALEGGANCQRCHEAGRRVAAARCLSCHKPIADRIARRTGVHRTAKECVSCHVEHAGVDAELRHMDTRTFDHAGETGFALDGLHAKTAANCAACHKTRSFVEARPVCSSCHTDVHKGALGTDCTRCHSTKIPFKESRSQFDHTGARFQLTGAHREVKGEKCHKTSAFRGMEFGTCSACHESPHGRKFPATCTSCHTTEDWGTRSVDHSTPNFPLA